MKEFLFKLVTHPVFAQDPPRPDGSGSGGTFINPLKSGGVTDFNSLIVKILEVLIAIGIPVLVLMIVYAGFLFVTAGGSQDKIDKAKSSLWWAVIGGAVLIGAKVIAEVVRATVGAI
ncbi:MAG: pilin [Patescibacteria group bacterium]